MNEKNWWDNIPKNGVLCHLRNTTVDAIDSYIIKTVVVIRKLGSMVDCDDGNLYYPEFLTPLTAEEWLELAPWQDMETAPIYESILVIIKADFSDEYKVTVTMLHAKIQRNAYLKWLPLPLPKVKL